MVSLIGSPDSRTREQWHIPNMCTEIYKRTSISINIDLYHHKLTRNSFYFSNNATKETKLRNLIYIEVLKPISDGLLTNVALWNC